MRASGSQVYHCPCIYSRSLASVSRSSWVMPSLLFISNQKVTLSYKFMLSKLEAVNTSQRSTFWPSKHKHFRPCKLKNWPLATATGFGPSLIEEKHAGVVIHQRDATPTTLKTGMGREKVGGILEVSLSHHISLECNKGVHNIGWKKIKLYN